MYSTTVGLQAEYREKARQRVKESPTLSAQFPALKSLAAELKFHNVSTPAFDRNIRYAVNVANAKAVFRVHCPNDECVRGDFDLTKDLAKAIGKRQKVVRGEIPCPGWLSKETIRKVRCPNVLRYKLTPRYR
jgi:hypothetical protein